MVSDPAESGTSRLRSWLHAMLAHRHGSEVYQTSTMGALLDGVYDGDVTLRELLQHGNFGLGTFTRSLSEPGVTIIDVLVDYSRNTELFAEMHDGVLE
jgi:alpha-acetolactate decarboxylase